MKDQPIIIAGAGLSGLTAAINLRKAGFPVRIYEKADRPGKRFSGDFQGLQNWWFKEDVLDFLKKISIKINFLCRPFSEISFVGPNLKGVKLRFEKPLFYLVQRGSLPGCLDYELTKQALGLGIEIIRNRPYRASKDEVDIVATGPIFGGEYIGIAVGYTFETDLEDQAIGILDDRIACDAYAYLVVVNRKATLATCIAKNFEDASWFLETTLKLFQKIRKFKIENAHRIVGCANLFLPGKWAMHKKIYIGEAGGFQEAQGFGMRLAMLTGYLAAKSITENKNFNDLIKKEGILEWLRCAVVNRFLYALCGKTAYNFIINWLRKSRDPFKSFNKLYSPSLVKKLVYPMAKFALRKKVQDYRKIY